MSNETKTHVIDGKTFVEVERKAKVGDYVVYNKGTEYEAIYKVTGYFPEDSTPPYYRVAHDPDEDGATVGVSIERSITLEPVDQAPESIVDIIANLTRRVAALESQLRDTQNNVERQGVEIAEVTNTADMALRKAVAVDERDDLTIDRVNALEERIESNEADIRDLDERTQPKSSAKLLSEAFLALDEYERKLKRR